MRLSEVAEVIVQPQYGYGSQEHQLPQATIPANSTLFYNVELVELTKVCQHARTTLPQSRWLSAALLWVLSSSAL